MKRYHVIHGDRRTTVSLPDTLAGLLAVKLGKDPGTQAAHTAVRQWLQARLDTSQGRSKVSQWLQDEATLEVSDKTVSSKYLDHVTGIALDEHGDPQEQEILGWLEAEADTEGWE